MCNNWKMSLKLWPHYRNFENWPQIKASSLPKEQRSVFIRNRNIVALVLNGMAVSRACRKHDLHPSFGTYLLNRCLIPISEEKPALTAGLVPYNRIRKERRNMTLSNGGDSGSRLSVDKILYMHPKIKKSLDSRISNFVRRRKGAEVLTPTAFHRMFIRELEDINWPNTLYPFDRVRQGFFAITNYFNNRVRELKLVKQKQRISSPASMPCKRVYEEIEIDEQISDVSTSVDLYLDENHLPIPVARTSVALAIDVASDAVLGYQVCLTQHPSHEDILALLEKIRRQWKPLKITTRGVKYLSGAMFPSALDENIRHLQPGTIKLDNALSHHANRIRKYVCDDWGTTINFGHPASPKSRNFVEYAFSRLNRLTHRFESTSGSSVTDPKRETKKNSKTPPVVKLHEFEEMLEVVLAAHNIRPQARLGSFSPLDVIRYQSQTFPLTMNYSELDRESCAFKDEKKVSVKELKNERRAPFVNFEGLRYTGPCLSNARLINRQILLRFDIRDIRKLEAFDLNGNALGELLAPRSRQSFPLSIRTLKRINKKVRNSSGLEQRSVDGYFMGLFKATKSTKNNLELIRVYREIQSSCKVVLPNLDSPQSIHPDCSKGAKPKFNSNQSWQSQFLKGGDS